MLAESRRRIDEARAEFNSSSTRRIGALGRSWNQDLASIEARRERRAGESRQLSEPRRSASKIAPARLAEGGNSDRSRCVAPKLDREAVVPKRAFSWSKPERRQSRSSHLAEHAKPFADRLKAAAAERMRDLRIIA